jgi:predicted small lipoprotein YifL
MTPHQERRAALLVLLLLTPSLGACGGGGESRNPTAPSAVARHSLPHENTVRPIIAAPAANRPVNLPAPANLIGPADVNFPPRNETFDFRRSLENLYRDELNRTLTSSFVDIEGAVVWVQEYLRYRVNQCSHLAASARVMSQIEGRGISPVCGSTGSLAFPPRNESVDFMQQLEAKYQHDLRRAATGTYVDSVGNVVWTQEYLRYRAAQCTSQDAYAKIRTQISGGGVPDDCEPGVGIVGYWDGTYADGRVFIMAFEGPDGAQPRGTVDGIFLRVQSRGNNFTFTANYFNLDGEWVATWDGGDTIRGTARGSLTYPGPFTLRRRR